MTLPLSTSGRESAVDEHAVQQALSGVHDPCSIAAGRPLSLIDMGMVRRCTFVDGVAHVTLLPTTPACLMLGEIAASVESTLLELVGVEQVELELDSGECWTPELMNPVLRTIAGASAAHDTTREGEHA